MAHKLYSVIGVVAFLTVSSLNLSVMANDMQEAFSKSTRTFSLDLYSKISADNPDKNLIFSPFSIQTCVGLAFAGAGGKTADEIATGLHLTSNDPTVVSQSFKSVLDEYVNSPTLKIANKFYIKNGYEVTDTFKEIATKNFHSEAENLDFTKSAEAAGTMNGWVESKTNGKIKNLISPDSLDDYTRMVLINAIHFKGTWLNQFKKDDTVKDDFWISETESTKVDMMNTKAKFNYGVFEELDATGLEMGYKSNFSMFVLLPNSRTGLKALEDKLKNIDLMDLKQKMRRSEVIVKFPKFRAEFEIQLEETLKKMGMGTMFSDSADFSKLLKSPEPLKVSKVIHKAFIEVNEEGAEAAAATGITMTVMSAVISLQPPKQFIVDRPFIYILKNKNGVPFFVGRMKTI